MGHEKEKPPGGLPRGGCEPQAGCTDKPRWRECSRKAERSVKTEEAPRHFGRGPVSDKRLVLTSRGRESVAARRNGA